MPRASKLLGVTPWVADELVTGGYAQDSRTGVLSLESSVSALCSPSFTSPSLHLHHLQGRAALSSSSAQREGHRAGEKSVPPFGWGSWNCFLPENMDGVLAGREVRPSRVNLIFSGV